MAAFATVTDLELFARDEIPPGQIDQLEAEQALDLASDIIRGYVRSHISSATETAEFDGISGDVFELPQRPVTAVTAVEITDRMGNTVVVSSSDWTWTRGGKLRRILYTTTLPAGWSADSGWGGPDATVTVTYTHGLAAVPGDVKAIALALARRMTVNPDGYIREAIGSYNVGYATTDGQQVGQGSGQGSGASVHLLAVEKMALNRYRRRTWS